MIDPGRLQRLSVVLAVMAAAVGAATAADRYELDLAHSRVGFSVRHLVISNVKGHFADFRGAVLYDDEEPGQSTVEVVIQAASLDTANQGRDDHVRGADFLNTENHPEITFKSTEVRRDDDGWVAVGRLTILGVSKRVVMPFELAGPIADPWGKTRLGVTAELIIDRRDFGVTWSRTMDNGGLVVGNEIRIELSIEAVMQEEESAAG